MSKTLRKTESGNATHAGKYLTFQLDTETYGLTILKVLEIIGMIDVTPLPRTPPFIRGVINLRGRIIPVVDLRSKFGRNAFQEIERTCVIVLEVDRGDVPITIGINVNEVSEVLEFHAEQLEPPPAFEGVREPHIILGVGKAGNKVVKLLDADRVLSDLDIDSILEALEVGMPA